jgi:uncharacterized protein YfdQ (DUF2303 family)
VPEYDDTTNMAEALVREARAAVAPREMDPSVTGDFSQLVPAGWTREEVSVEHLEEVPRRKRGTVRLAEGGSMRTYVNEHKVESSGPSTPTHLYAEHATWRVTAVFNDACHDEPGWADHRAVLQLQHTEEWQHWAANDGKYLSQEEFAEHVEDGLLEIVEPAAADLLEMAQTFHANVGAAVKSSHILASGERKLVYDETITASAGATGELVVPHHFTLALAPFEGSLLERVTARLRFRLRGGDLRLGYAMEYPQRVLREAFDATVGYLEAETGLVVLRGQPPQQ